MSSFSIKGKILGREGSGRNLGEEEYSQNIIYEILNNKRNKEYEEWREGREEV